MPPLVKLTLEWLGDFSFAKNLTDSQSKVKKSSKSLKWSSDLEKRLQVKLQAF